VHVLLLPLLYGHEQLLRWCILLLGEQ